MALEPVFSAMSPLWAITNSVARLVLSRNAKKLSCPVISVGNIVAGGVGKTEVTATIALALVKQGKRVVVASRGYGSRWERSGGVASDFATAVSLRFPDESLVTLKKVPGVSVAVGADRAAVLAKHWEELSPDVVLLDDGFQHFAIRRELDVLVHDFSVRWPILRDLPNALKKARLRIAMSEVPLAWQDAGPWVKARYQLKGVTDAVDRIEPLPKKALAFCGIGNPSRFRKSLEAAGVAVVGFKNYRDHAAYDAKVARELVGWKNAQRESGLPLLTTLKDYVKLATLIESQGGVPGFEPMWVNLELCFAENEGYFWKTVSESLGSGAP